MTITIEQLKSRFSAIEPDESMYEGISVTEIPLLEQLLDHPEPWMAARAVLCLARIKDREAVSILQRIAGDGRPEVRVAVAVAARILNPSDADVLLPHLLEDTDVGVRKFAIQAVSNESNMDIRGKLQWMAKRDRADFIRGKSRERLLELKPAVFIEFDPTGRDIDSEHVVIRNNDDHEIDLKDWTISDRAGHKMKLSAILLAPGAEVRIWTKSGHNDASNLYWGRKQAVWNNKGDTLHIYDALGKELCGFHYP